MCCEEMNIRFSNIFLLTTVTKDVSNKKNTKKISNDFYEKIITDCEPNLRVRTIY
jgi:hypothetical protein